MTTPTFTKTLNYYQTKKEAIKTHTQYIPDFCIHKNQEAYENAQRSIIEDAGLNYNFYCSSNFDITKLLPPWQTKVLKRLEKSRLKKYIRAICFKKAVGKPTLKYGCCQWDKPNTNGVL